MLEFCNVIPFDFTTNSIFKILKKTYFLKRQKSNKSLVIPFNNQNQSSITLLYLNRNPILPEATGTRRNK